MERPLLLSRARVHTSFTPDGDWFVFDTVTSKTIRRGFPTKVHALNWIARGSCAH